MKRSGRERREPKPVESVEVSDSKVKLRIILFIVFLAIAVVAFVIAFVQCTSLDRGWQTIDVSNGTSETCAADLTFRYYVDDDMKKSQFTDLTNTYADLCTKAYRLFNSAAKSDSGINAINSNPNSNIAIDGALYSALRKATLQIDGYIYRAPIYAYYESLFYCTDDASAEQFDPHKNTALGELISRIAEFAADTDCIRLEFKSDNIVELFVSDGYLEFARDHGINVFIDLFWLKNAFIVDYIAEGLIASGYTHGIISAHNGFSRCIDQNIKSLNTNIYDKYNGNSYIAGVLRFDGQMSSVSFNDSPKGYRFGYYYVYGDGSCVNSFIGVDGYNEFTMPSYLAYSRDVGCGDIAVNGYSVFVSTSWQIESINSLKSNGIYSVYCADAVIIFNDDHVNINPSVFDNFEYTTKFVD